MSSPSLEITNYMRAGKTASATSELYDRAVEHWYPWLLVAIVVGGVVAVLAGVPVIVVAIPALFFFGVVPIAAVVISVFGRARRP